MSKIPLAGVIGAPVGHSRSPRLHGTWLREYDIVGHYVPLHVEASDLERVLRAMPAMGFVGANVTIPHKEAALALADEVSPQAAKIGAANTLSFQDGKIYADNTDGYGFIANLNAEAPDWRVDAPVLILGAGGAARAVIVALQEAGLPEIRICNRTRGRAEALAAEFDAGVVDWEARAASLGDVGVLVNTTALGMTGGAALEISLEGLGANALVTDIVYTPLETQLIRAARARGLRAVDGLGMLLHQAVPGFERWFGLRPEVSAALRAAVLA